MAKKQPPLFKRFMNQAKKILKKPGEIMDQLSRAEKKAGKNTNQVKKFVEDLKLLIRLVRAWVKGEYKEVPVATIILALAAIIYFVSPIDLIPDWIIAAGFIDDAAVIAFVVVSLKSDLDDFRAWEKRNRDNRGEAETVA